jgi:hypothetical protein
MRAKKLKRFEFAGVSAERATLAEAKEVVERWITRMLEAPRIIADSPAYVVRNYNDNVEYYRVMPNGHREATCISAKFDEHDLAFIRTRLSEIRAEGAE